MQFTICAPKWLAVRAVTAVCKNYVVTQQKCWAENILQISSASQSQFATNNAHFDSCQTNWHLHRPPFDVCFDNSFFRKIPGKVTNAQNICYYLSEGMISSAPKCTCRVNYVLVFLSILFSGFKNFVFMNVWTNQ